jgi:hypothetical protein
VNELLLQPCPIARVRLGCDRKAEVLVKSKNIAPESVRHIYVVTFELVQQFAAVDLKKSKKTS